MRSPPLTTELAIHNAELLRILAVAGSSKGMALQERQLLLAQIARIELELENDLQTRPVLISTAQPDVRSTGFDDRVAVDTTRDLIVRAKVTLTARTAATAR